MPNTESERRQCYDAAIKAGISASAIRAFLSDNPEDECRINSALAPNAGPGSVVTPLYQIPGLTSYSGTAALPRADVPIVLPAIQGPASNASPLSTVSANSVVTGPAIAAPPAVVYNLPGAPASVPAAAPDFMTGWQGPSTLTAAPGAVMAPAFVPGGAAPASLLGGDNTMLLLGAAAIAAYLLWGR
jgi:hypothetical protein